MEIVYIFVYIIAEYAIYSSEYGILNTALVLWFQNWRMCIVRVNDAGAMTKILTFPLNFIFIPLI